MVLQRNGASRVEREGVMEEGRNGETDGFEGYYDDQVSKLEVPSVIYNPKHIIG